MNKSDHLLLGGVVTIIYVATLAYTTGPPDTAQSIVSVVKWVTIQFVVAGVPITLGSIAPDVDTAYGRHRKTGHNVFVLAGLYAFPVAFGNLAFVWVGAVGHVVADMVFSKRGVALFYPLSDSEYGGFRS